MCFKKSNISWPQQPLTERVSYIVKNWNFDDPFHKKGPVIGHLGARDDPTRINKFFDEMRLSRS